MWTVVKSKEDICRERAKKVAADKYGHIEDEMIRRASKVDRLPTEVYHKYQKARDLISQYEEEMYIYFLNNYTEADDRLSAPKGTDSFEKSKAMLNLGDASDVIESEGTTSASKKASKRKLDFGSAVDILSKRIL